jgi:hypothetical protein
LPIEQSSSGGIFGAVQSGTVIPFPLARRRAFIDRHARPHHDDAAPQRRGFDARIIEREVMALNAASYKRAGYRATAACVEPLSTDLSMTEKEIRT